MAIVVASSAAVCGWSVDDSCSKVLQEADADVAERCVSVAAEILYALSGRQFGVCEQVARPCRRKLAKQAGYYFYGPRWTPVLEGGQWSNISCGCQTDCSCVEVCELSLPGPIDHITQVLIDGVEHDLGEFRVDNKATVLRFGDECWPLCQDMNLASTEVGTYEITYGRGVPLPISGQAALAEFAVELCKSCLGDNSCALPRRVTSIQRQGVSMTLLDPMTFISEGKTGIYLVDAWLHAVNPQAKVRSGGVFSPDIPEVRVTTWP